MDVSEYMQTAYDYHQSGQHIFRSDGCTFAGFIHDRWPDAKLACYAHDYGRRGYLGFEKDNKESQRQNDKLFKEALELADVPACLVIPMYMAVRFQSITGLSPQGAFGVIFITTLLGLAWWHSSQ